MSVTDEQILAWHDALAAGGTISLDGQGREVGSLVMAVVRWLNGLGPDATDDLGEISYARVVEALGDARPASEIGHHRQAAAAHLGLEPIGDKTIVAMSAQESADWLKGGGFPISSVV